MLLAVVRPVESLRRLEHLMAQEGWTKCGAAKWKMRVRGATEMIVAPGGRMRRITTRDAESGVLLEDLWTQGGARDRRLRRSFRRPRDIDVEVEASAIDEQGVEQAPEGEEPLRPLGGHGLPSGLGANQFYEHRQARFTICK